MKGPYKLEQALYDKMITQEKRTPAGMDFYYCGRYYWVRIRVEKRYPDLATANLSGPELLQEIRGTYRGIGFEQDGTWHTSVLTMLEDRPCN